MFILANITILMICMEVAAMANVYRNRTNGSELNEAFGILFLLHLITLVSAVSLALVALGFNVDVSFN